MHGVIRCVRNVRFTELAELSKWNKQTNKQTSPPGSSFIYEIAHLYNSRNWFIT